MFLLEAPGLGTLYTLGKNFQRNYIYSWRGMKKYASHLLDTADLYEEFKVTTEEERNNYAF
jgi:hypothetical protein